MSKNFKFKVGDRVVVNVPKEHNTFHKYHGTKCAVTKLCFGGYETTDGVWIEAYLELEEIWDSPLYRVMSEEDV